MKMTRRMRAFNLVLNEQKLLGGHAERGRVGGGTWTSWRWRRLMLLLLLIESADVKDGRCGWKGEREGGRFEPFIEKGREG